jgi:hypothetical protein
MFPVLLYLSRLLDMPGQLLQVKIRCSKLHEQLSFGRSTHETVSMLRRETSGGTSHQKPLQYKSKESRNQ